MTRPDHIELVAPGRNLRFSARLGESSSTPSGAVGGWEVVPRPRRRPLTAWRGTPEPQRLSVPTLIDGFPNESVEDDCNTLMVMGGLHGSDRQPPELILRGGVPYNVDRRPTLRWVIESLEWGAYTLRPDDDARVRQAVTINLMVPEEDDQIKRLKARGDGRSGFIAHAPKGSTYEKMAVKYLNSKRFGGRLAKYNGDRSPDQKFSKPRKVKIPPNSLVGEWKRELAG